MKLNPTPGGVSKNKMFARVLQLPLLTESEPSGPIIRGPCSRYAPIRELQPGPPFSPKIEEEEEGLAIWKYVPT